MIEDSSGDVSEFEDSPVSSSSSGDSDNMETVDEELKVLKRQLDEHSTKKGEKEKVVKPKRKRTKHPPGYVTRPRTAYMYYSSHIRPSVKEENPTLGFAEISKMVGAKWAALTSEEKEPFKTLADADHKRWEEEKKNTPNIEPPKHPGIAGKSPRHMAIPLPAPPEAEPKPPPRRSKKRKPTKNPDMPTQGRSPYIIFRKENHTLIKQKLKEDNPNVTEPEVMRHVGEAWRKLSTTEKEGYKLKSKQDAERYQKEMLVYDKKQQKKEETVEEEEIEERPHKRQKKTPQITKIRKRTQKYKRKTKKIKGI